MPKGRQEFKSVVMLTADRQIDRRILLEADSLEHAGWKVTILGMPLDSGQADTDPRVVRVGQHAVSINQKNVLIDTYQAIRRLLPEQGRLMRSLKALAWRYMVNREKLFLDFFLPDALRFQADVFMAHDLPMLPVAVEAASRQNAKAVYDSHELYCEQEFSEREKKQWAQIEADHIRRCSAVITVNPSIAKEIENRYGVHNVNVIFNAERKSRKPRKTKLFHNLFGLTENKKILLMQGGLSQGRNLEVLVDAIRFVENPLVDLVILGDGPARESMQRIVNANYLADRVHFHSSVPQQELLTFTEAADAGIIPYQPTCLNNYYCTPNKLFEFIAAGVPVVGSDLPEVRNLVMNRQIGLIGDMSNARGVAALIDEFFSSHERIEYWQRNVLVARESICWEHEGTKLVSIFRDLV